MVAWTLSAIAVIVPDILQVTNIGLLLLLFISTVRFLVFLNPLTYLIETFRFAMLGIRTLRIWVDVASLAASMAGASLAGTFFRRLSPISADYE
jgi:ABC-type polysaccharide/polyol phosphate export permease